MPKIKSKSKVIKEVRPTGATAPVYSVTGEKLMPVELPEIFSQKPINQLLLAQAARVYRMNLRQGTQSTKTRSEVDGSTRKIYRQKGTGRARHGSLKAPIFVGGGIAFGPKPRDFDFNLNRKMRRLALAHALSAKAAAGDIAVIKDLSKIEPKTKQMSGLLKKIDIKGRILFVLTDMPTAIRSARNLEAVKLRPASAVSFWDVYNAQKIIFAAEALENINRK